MNRTPTLVLGLLTIVCSAVFSPVLRADETRPREGLTEKTPHVFLLSGARIVDRAGHQWETGQLLVRDGLIAAVGASISVPPEATEIHLEGKVIYPAWIEPYSEADIASDESDSGYWNSGVQPQRAAYRLADLTDDDEAFRQQGFGARLIAPSDGIIRGTSCVVLTGSRDSVGRLLKSEAAMHVRLTADRRGRDAYPGSPMGAVALARQAFYDAQWYQQARRVASFDAQLEQPEVNRALQRLVQLTDAGELVMFAALDEQYFMRADRFAREFGLRAVSVGSGDEYRRLDQIRQSGRTVIVPLDFPKAPNVASPQAIVEATLDDLLHWDLAPENPGRLHAAGVTIALTAQGLEKRSEFLANLRKAVERGLPADEALRAITQTPAELLDLADAVGTLAPGKLASLVVCSGDLFDEKTKVLETWVAGERYRWDPPREDRWHGLWQVDSLPGLSSEAVQLSVEDDGKKVNAEWVVPSEEGPDQRRKLDRLKVQDRYFQAQFDAKPWKLSGMVLVDGVLLPAAGEQTAQIAGRLYLPDGQQQSWTASKVSDEPLAKPEEDKDEKNEEDESDEVNRQEGPNEDEVESGAEGEGAEGEKSEDEAAAAAAAAAEEEEEEEEEREDAEAEEEAAIEPPKQETAEEGDEPREEGEQEQPESAPAEADSTPVKASLEVVYPLGAFGLDAPPPQAPLLALEHATIWSCGPQGILEDATLLIGEGRVRAVGTEVSIPAEAERLDVSGMHISPGIIDCHSHMATDGGVNESTQAITAEVRIGDFIDATDITIYRQLAGGVTTANVLHGSANPIGGQNQVIKLRWGASSEELKFAEAPPGIKFALGENVKQSNWGSNFSTRYPQSRMGVPELVRDAFQNAQEYRQKWARWERERRGLPPRRDLELDALAEVLEGKRWVHCHSYRQDEIVALLRVLEDFGVQIGSLQHILEGYKVAEVLRAHGATASSFSDWWAYKFEVYDAIPYNGALMYENDIVVSFNSDDDELGRHLNQEAAKAMKYGKVPAEEALKFVTLNPAKQLRIDQLVGSLEEGKHADFVVWSGSPLSTLSRCEQTWIDGRKYFDRDQDIQLRERDQQHKAELIQKILTSGSEMSDPGEENRRERDLWPREDLFCHDHQVGDRRTAE